MAFVVDTAYLGEMDREDEAGMGWPVGDRAAQIFRAPLWDREQVKRELVCVSQRKEQKVQHCGRS